MLTGGKNVIPHAVRDVADAAAAFSARIGPDRHFDSQENVEEALAECCSPQNVTVIGMTGSGKSSTLDALAGISGVGGKKLQAYGEDLLRVLASS